MRGAIEVDRLVKRYGAGAPPAVDGVSFDVAPGEIFCLLGPNGSGKSTTLGVLGTLIEPTSGRVSVAGHDVVDRPDEVRKRIGLVLQDAGVDPDTSGRELLTRHSRLLGAGRRAAADRAEELLSVVALTEAGDRRISTYSGGMRRRLDIVVALVGEPQVLFLDEPTTGLDPTARGELWDLVARRAAAGTTVLLTTQYLEEADRLADRIMIVDQGRVVIEGTPAALKRQVGNDVIHVTVDPTQVELAAHAIGGSHSSNGAITLTTDNGDLAVSALVTQLTRHGIDVRSIAVARPTLDDVFLAVTSHHATRENSP